MAHHSHGHLMLGTCTANPAEKYEQHQSAAVQQSIRKCNAPMNEPSTRMAKSASAPQSPNTHTIHVNDTCAILQ